MAVFTSPTMPTIVSHFRIGSWCARQYAMTDGVAVRKESARQGFIDYRDKGSRRRIGIVERAPGDQWNLERAEVDLVGDLIIPELGNGTGSIPRATFDTERIRAADVCAAVDRKSRTGGRGDDTGQRGDPVAHVRDELQPAIRLGTLALFGNSTDIVRT